MKFSNRVIAYLHTLRHKEKRQNFFKASLERTNCSHARVLSHAPYDYVCNDPVDGNWLAHNNRPHCIVLDVINYLVSRPYEQMCSYEKLVKIEQGVFVLTVF